jgi:preprotein translocase subunit YajC
MTNTILFILAQAPGALNPLFLVGMVLVMYFFMLRPQMKKQKEAKAFAASTAVGDKIVTIGGVHGKISKINTDGSMLLEGERNTYFTIEASAISMEMTKALQKRNAPAVVETKA